MTRPSLMLVHPGAEFSIYDVYRGLGQALERDPRVEVHFCNLRRRFDVMVQALAILSEERQDVAADPTTTDAALLASESAVAWALRKMPDWVVVVSGMFFHPDGIVLMRRAGLRVAVLLTESPYAMEYELRLARYADLVLTNERTAVPELSAACPAHYLPHAWAEGVHEPPPAEDLDGVPAHDVVLVGTPFPERVKLLEAVDWTGIDLGLYGQWTDWLGPDSPLRPFVHEGLIPNARAAALYHRARIGLNLYRSCVDISGQDHAAWAESLNPRAYELAAMRCFTISEFRREVPERFGGLVPTFVGSEELEAQIRRWLPDEAGRAAARAQLRERVAGDTWTARAATLLRVLAKRTQAMAEDEGRRHGAGAARETEALLAS